MYEDKHINYACVCVYRFLYQVFPGTPRQCERLLRQAARTGDLKTAEKLVRNPLPSIHTHSSSEHPDSLLQVLFFKAESSFVNSSDAETGNTGLHLAARHGYFVSMTVVYVL